MSILAKKNGQWVTIANYVPNTSSSKFKFFTYIPTVDDLEEGEVGFYIYIPEYDELKLYVERTITEAHIPDGTSSIGDYAFYNCTSLTSVTIGNSVTSISTSAFRYCTSLETVIFRGTPTSINGTVFSGCTQSTLNIYVPWSSGAVAGTPWGATNATIHYNTDTSNM